MQQPIWKAVLTFRACLGTLTVRTAKVQLVKAVVVVLVEG